MASPSCREPRRRAWRVPDACAAVLLLVAGGGCATVGRQEAELPPAAPIAFEEITEAAGLNEAGGRPCAWGDYDADGHVDVVIGAKLFRNNGDGTFAGVTAGPKGDGVWADVDNDGALDFLSVRGTGTLYRNTGDGHFESLPFSGNPTPSMPRAAVADANNDGRLDVYVTNYEKTFGGPIMPDYLSLAKGTGGFDAPIILSGTACWAARGADWADFDNDGDQDLYVSNYRLMPNSLWVNDGTGQFRDEAKQRGVYGVATAGKEPASTYYPAYEYTGHTIGSCWGDLNNDGNLDLVVVNFSHPPTWQNRVQVLINSGPPDYTFSDLNRDAAAGVYWQESYAKGALGDYDNDGDLDLYITAVYPRDRGDLFENDGSGRFKPVGDTLDLRTGNSYQVSWADVDNDGFLDLLAAGRLFRNAGNRHAWLKVKVVGGAGSNVSAAGARVSVTAGEQTQVREARAGNSGNQAPLMLHFGLGDHIGKVTIDVRFPSGRRMAVKTRPRTTCVLDERNAKGPNPR